MTKLKIGDKVVMNDRYYDKHQGEVFTIKAGPEMIGRTECFWLEGYEGAYCADGLDLYKPPTNEEWFCGLSTERKAHFFAERFGGSVDRYNNIYDTMLEWLKEKHNE